LSYDAVLLLRWLHAVGSGPGAILEEALATALQQAEHLDEALKHNRIIGMAMASSWSGTSWLRTGPSTFSGSPAAAATRSCGGSLMTSCGPGGSALQGELQATGLRVS